ncbi:MAG: DUF1217 domain-containing protein [Marinovum sp.]|nr:DUF1217 domain-containing protein [Marinovum sp.]
MTFTPVILGGGLAGYNYIQRTQDTQLATLSNTSKNKRETAEVLENLPQVQTAQEIMDDPLLLRVALGAFGLDEDINNRAFIQDVLESDLSDSTSLANRLTDRRYLALAQTFGFNSPNGPQVLGSQEASALTKELEAVASADDLLNNPKLLRGTLEHYGLSKDDASNRYFLEQVFASDLNDPASFVNSLNNTRYADMVAALDLPSSQAAPDLFSFATLAQSRGDTIKTSDDLLGDADLLKDALQLFGLEGEGRDQAFLRSVLDSDLEDASSFANQQQNDLWSSFAKAFGFGERLARPGSFRAENTRFDSLVSNFGALEAPFASSEDMFSSSLVTLSALQFFDLPSDSDSFSRAGRILTSDSNDPNSQYNGTLEPRWRLFADASPIEAPDTEWRPPDGFADAIVTTYLERQFEIAVGNVDPNMRLAIGFEREFDQLLENATSNNARWFGVMASEPLRAVFEGALGLPDAIGTLDLEQQLGVFQERAESRLGSADLATLSAEETRADLIQRFLSTVTLTPESTSAPRSGASVILSNVQGSLGLI